MNEKDEIRLRDMLDAARKAQRFIAGRNREALDSDDMLTFALTRAIEIIGEAASRISKETSDQYPEIDWKGITGMRHKAIHDYMEFDLDILWKTVTVRIPELIIQLESISPLEDEDK